MLHTMYAGASIRTSSERQYSHQQHDMRTQCMSKPDTGGLGQELLCHGWAWKGQSNTFQVDDCMAPHLGSHHISQRLWPQCEC